MTAGAHLPGALRLELIIPLFLVGEIANRLTSGPARRAAAVTAVTAVAALGAPLRLGPVIAIAAGLVAGARAEGSGR